MIELRVGDRVKLWSGPRSKLHTPILLGKGTVTRVEDRSAWVDWDTEEDNAAYGGHPFSWGDALSSGSWTVMDAVERLAELA